MACATDVIDRLWSGLSLCHKVVNKPAGTARRVSAPSRQTQGLAQDCLTIKGSLNLSRFTHGISRRGAQINLGGDHSIQLSYGGVGQECNSAHMDKSSSGDHRLL
ncbi:MAG: hypothetical protein ACYYK0_06235 [Candidatus Eutrophobiaceae bacterium]